MRREGLAFTALLALGALDAAGYGVIAPVVPEIADRTGAGPGVIGALVTSFAAGQLVGYPLAGALLQRRDASAVLFAALALVGAGDIAFVIGDGLGVWFPARVVQGIGAAGLWIGVVFALIERWPDRAYRRLSALLAAYSIGWIVGPAIGAAGGIRGPFLLHLGLVLAGAAVLAALGAPRERPVFASDRSTLRTPGFVLASAGVLLIALGAGTLEGPLPLHFAERLGQAEIAALFVLASVVVGVAAVAAGWVRPRLALATGAVLLPAGVGMAGGTDTVALWIVAVAVTAVGFGAAEAGSLGVLLEAIGVGRIVLAMVVWSQAWAVGYTAGPAAAGGVAEALGFGAIWLVPLAGSVLVAAAFPRAAATPRAPRPARG